MSIHVYLRDMNSNKKLIMMTAGGAVVFWATTVVTSLLPIAADYRAAYSNWSPQTVWVASLPMGIIIGAGVSYFLLRYFEKIPSRNPILKSEILSVIALVFALILIDIPQSFFGSRIVVNATYFFLIGAMFNVARFLFLGLVVGYLYSRLHGSAKIDINQKEISS